MLPLRTSPRIVLPALTLLMGLLPALRPAAAAPTPLEAASKSLRALKESRLDDFAAAMHPEALEQFRGLLLQVLEAAAREGKEAEILPLFPGAADGAALRALAPIPFFTSFLRGTVQRDPDLKEALARSHHRFLGEVTEGSVVHVAYRLSMRFDGRDIALPSVITLKKSGTDWLALLTGDAEGMARQLARRFAGKPPTAEGETRSPAVLGQLREGKNAVHLVVRWTMSSPEGNHSKVTVHSIGPKDAAWKLLGNGAALQKHLAANYAPL
jgi:hypothetical protein